MKYETKKMPDVFVILALRIPVQNEEYSTVKKHKKNHLIFALLWCRFTQKHVSCIIRHHLANIEKVESKQKEMYDRDIGKNTSVHGVGVADTCEPVMVRQAPEPACGRP